MSLLDDVSIVVTPNGYKAGELYAVVPVPTFGADVVEDGNFPYPNTVWGGDASTVFAEGSATLTGVGAFKNLLTQTTILESGKLYEVTYTCDLSGVTSGSLKLQAFSDSSALRTVLDGTNTVELTANGTTLYIGEGGMSGTAIFTNISVKEVLVPSADMDVTRATAATRVDENGLVNYAEVLGSEEIDCGNFECAVPLDSWSTDTGWSIGSGLASCDGTNFATISQSKILVVGKTYKYSFTISNLTQGGVRLFLGNTVGSTHSANGTFTGYITYSSGSSILLQARDSFIGSIDNVSIKEVTRDNVPRIDYTGGGCPHILAEPQRTNIAQYSEQLDVAPNVIDNANYTSNFYVSPNGLTTAPKFEETTANDRHGFYQYQTVTSNSYTVSIYTKQINRRYICLQSDLETTAQYTFFDLQLGTVVSEGTGWTATIDSVGSSGWYRLTATCTAVAGSRYFIWGCSLDGLSNTYVGDGSLFTFWGLQVEEGSYATSYIPTVASTVTRNQDIFTRDGIGSLINSTEGVLFVEMAAFSNDGTNRTIALSDGTGNNLVRLYFSNSSNRIVSQVKVGGSTQVTFDITGITVIDFNKVALKYKENDFSIWINGVERGTDTSGTTPTSMNRLALDNGSGSENLFGKVKQLQVYKTALSDTQLAALTS